MNDDEIRKALEDIAELKKSVRGNLRRIRPVFLDKGFFPFLYRFGDRFSRLLLRPAIRDRRGR